MRAHSYFHSIHKTGHLSWAVQEPSISLVAKGNRGQLLFSCRAAQLSRASHLRKLKAFAPVHIQHLTGPERDKVSLFAWESEFKVLPGYRHPLNTINMYSAEQTGIFLHLSDWLLPGYWPCYWSQEFCSNKQSLKDSAVSLCFIRAHCSEYIVERSPSLFTWETFAFRSTSIQIKQSVYLC